MKPSFSCTALAHLSLTLRLTLTLSIMTLLPSGEKLRISKEIPNLPRGLSNSLRNPLLRTGPNTHIYTSVQVMVNDQKLHSSSSNCTICSFNFPVTDSKNKCWVGLWEDMCTLGYRNNHLYLTW